jgi:hypothetical protein
LTRGARPIRLGALAQPQRGQPSTPPQCRPWPEDNAGGAVYGRGSLPLVSSAMELIIILNRCHRFRGFVYQHAHFGADKKSIEVVVRPRDRSLLALPSAGARL